MFEQMIQAIERHDTIIIHRHNNPDGDALGSQLGLKHLIADNYPGKKVYAVGDSAGRYAFMADSVMDEIADEAYQGALAVILDCGARHLISDDRYTLAGEAVRIDHHVFSEEIVTVEVIDHTGESCCGLIADMAMEAGWAISTTAATLL
jgi:phosphoesterase RecJ-like protein